MDDDIDCARVLHALYEFLDGELASDRRRHVESHLGGCPHCYSAFDFEAELRIVVRSRLQADAPGTLWARIAAALEQEGFRPPPGYGLRPGPSLGGGPSPLGGSSPLR